MGDEIRTAGGTIDDLCVLPLAAGDGRPNVRGKNLIGKWEIDPGRGLFIGNQPSGVVGAGVRAVRFQGGDLAALALPLLAQMT